MNFNLLGTLAITLTTTWTRYELTFGSPASGAVQFAIGYTSKPSAGGYVFPGISGGTIYAWGGQLERGAALTSDIITGASAVTRSADVISFDMPSPDDTLLLTFDDDTVQYIDASGAAFPLPTGIDQNKMRTISSEQISSTPITGVSLGAVFNYNSIGSQSAPADVWRQ